MVAREPVTAVTLLQVAKYRNALRRAMKSTMLLDVQPHTLVEMDRMCHSYTVALHEHIQMSVRFAASASFCSSDFSLSASLLAVS